MTEFETRMFAKLTKIEDLLTEIRDLVKRPALQVIPGGLERVEADGRGGKPKGY